MVDTILYKTLRKTPTVVRKNFKVSRIRNFYMLKVKFTQNSIDQKIDDIVGNFPKIDEIHPFYRYWFNIMYDKDHFKIALGQLHQCKTLVDKIGTHYVKLLKHADSLFQCKTLKRAALGRMVTLLKKLDPYLKYLEQIRQHMTRLPAIDPSTRSIILTGYPSAGKSSLLNELTSANVDVQPWAFTTKSLFIGHAEHRGMRFQIIDTPGLLDHNIEERNNIELQAITALAYLNAAIVFVLDVTQGSGFIQKQCQLFESLKPFFNNKPILVTLSKIDLWTPDSISPADLALIQQLSPQFSLQDSFNLVNLGYFSKEQLLSAQNKGGQDAIQAIQAAQQEDLTRQQIIQKNAMPILCTSSITSNGLERMFGVLADMLLSLRQASSQVQKPQDISGQGAAAIPGLFVAQPKPRDNKQRPPVIPVSVQLLNQQMLNPRPQTAEDGFITEKQREFENGGVVVYNFDERKHWDIPEEWKYDQIPYIHNGKNILDFITIDQDIEQYVLQLEAEEDAIKKQGKTFDDEALQKRLAEFIRVTARGHGTHKSLRIHQKHSQLKEIKKLGINPIKKSKAGDVQIMKSRSREERIVDEAGPMRIDDYDATEKIMRATAGQRLAFKQPHGEKMPKHLFSGKMSAGTKDWR